MVQKTVLRSASISVCLAAASVVAGCSSTGTSVKTTTVARAKSSEYFSESKYGVKASPRVVVSAYDTTTKDVALVPIPKPIGASGDAGTAYALTPPAKKLRRGGGREQVGKPYKVAGRWYTPKDEPGYSRAGKASWYGDAFHGRLTANGEIYDMNNLTAAHPTLPLPSYARVTNLANGRSVIVRINDRGPYANGRVIDLSKRAAHVLETKQAGVGQVRVDYIGKAPVNGEDDAFLLASFRQNGTGNANEDARLYAAAMNGAMPATAMVAQAASVIPVSVATQPLTAFAEIPAAAGLPGVNPTPFEPSDRPMRVDGSAGIGMLTSPFGRRDPSAPLGYNEFAKPATERFGAVLSAPTKATDHDWKIGEAASGELVQIQVETLASRTEAQAEARKLQEFGQVALLADGPDTRLVIDSTPDKADTVLSALWKAGYRDAFTLH